jgi:hypothetical protein
MQDRDKITDIRNVLAEQVRHEPRFGSYLGLVLRRRWPDLNVKAQFGGLRRFVREHGDGQIEFRGNRGGDDVFAVPGAAPLAGLVAAAASGPMYLRAWHAITKPGDRDIAAVNASTGEVVVVGANGQVPEGYRRVDGLTEKDYREMARTFVSAIDGANSHELESVISTDGNFWDAWLQAISKAGLARDWRKWRLQRLEAIVKDKLIAAGVPSEETGAIWSRLREATRKSRTAASASGGGVAPQRFDAGARSLATAAGSASQIRTIAHLTIDRLGESELRDIRFPLGAIADVLTALLRR